MGIPSLQPDRPGSCCLLHGALTVAVAAAPRQEATLAAGTGRRAVRGAEPPDARAEQGGAGLSLAAAELALDPGAALLVTTAARAVLLARAHAFARRAHTGPECVAGHQHGREHDARNRGADALQRPRAVVGAAARRRSGAASARAAKPLHLEAEGGWRLHRGEVAVELRALLLEQRLDGGKPCAALAEPLRRADVELVGERGERRALRVMEARETALLAHVEEVPVQEAL